MDGLLIDSEAYIEKAMFDVCRKYGKVFDWDMKVKVMGRTMKDVADIICESLELPISSAKFIGEVEAQYPILLPQTQLMPGVEKLLKHLKKHHIPTAIASSSQKNIEYDYKFTNIDPNFPNYFNHMLFGGLNPKVKSSKPAPEIFQVCREMFKELKDEPSIHCNDSKCTMDDQKSLPPPSSFLVFEDALNGVLAGLRAGMQVVWIPDPRMDVNGLMAKNNELRPTQVLQSMADFNPEDFGLPPYDH
jgi:pseudouridine-5'-monophosphatase